MHGMGSNNNPGGLSSLARAAGIVCLVLAVALAVPAGGSQAAGLSAIAPGLGDAATFSVLAALSMSATAAGTTVSGDLGLSPGLEVSRTGPWTVGGDEYFGTGGLSAAAQADALIAFNNLAGQGSNGVWSGPPWSPVPGVWTVAGDTTFAGTITLNGDYDDVWVFQVGRDMTFSGSVVMAGNAQACNVFWQIGRDATIGLGSTFVGTLIASRDITLTPIGVNVNGRIISLNGALTTGGTTISGPTCLPGPRSTPTPQGPPGPPGPPGGFVPEPGSVMLLGSGLMGLGLFGFALRRKRGTS